jgi:myo-inositol-1(or 4)-monophosphatase
VAAGALLVTEAGGLVGNFTGESDFMHQRECLAGNPRIYGQLVPLLSKYSKFAGVDAKLEASERIRRMDPSQSLYARSTVGLQTGQSSDNADAQGAHDQAEQPAKPAAARKLSRVRTPAAPPKPPSA